MNERRHDGNAERAPAAEQSSFRWGIVAGLQNAGVAVLAQDEALRYLWARNMPRSWKSDEDDVVGKTDDAVFPPETARLLSEVKSGILSGGSSRRIEIEIPSPGGSSWYQLWLDPCTEDDGQVVGVLTTAMETTEQRLREQTLRTLLREVSHRSKNLLAIIQSIASQTGRYADTVGEFLTRFRGRLQSLSSSQDLVTSSNWRGADLAQLINDQVARYCAEPAVNLRLEGENPYLNPNAALHVGLALHELAVNSVSYGALSSPDGRVALTVRALPENEMELVWTEELLPSTPDPERRRFGTVALERIVPASLNSEAELSIASGRLVYRLVLPADSLHRD